MGQAMKLALVSMIRDEADILPAFLEHASELFDMGFLLDHRSSDGFQKIMDDFCSGFSGWSYFKLDFPGRHQRDMSNIFMRRAFDAGVDAVIFLGDGNETLARKVALCTFLVPWVASMDVLCSIGTFSIIGHS